MRLVSCAVLILMLPMSMVSSADHLAVQNGAAQEVVARDDQGSIALRKPSLAGFHYVGQTPACTCPCGGTSWSIGSSACMGGYKTRCVDRDGQGGDCGWDLVKQGSAQVPCDGGEQCKPSN